MVETPALWPTRIVGAATLFTVRSSAAVHKRRVGKFQFHLLDPHSLRLGALEQSLPVPLAGIAVTRRDQQNVLVENSCRPLRVDNGVTLSIAAEVRYGPDRLGWRNGGERSL